MPKDSVLLTRYIIMMIVLIIMVFMLVRQNKQIKQLIALLQTMMLKVSELLSTLADSVDRGAITEKLRAEIAESTLESIIQGSPFAIISKNMNNEIVTWNTKATEIFGWTCEEICGKSFTILIPPELRGEELVLMNRLERDEIVDDFDTVRLAKDGRRIHVKLRIMPIKNKLGVIIGASKMVTVL